MSYGARPSSPALSILTTSASLSVVIYLVAVISAGSEDCSPLPFIIIIASIYLPGPIIYRLLWFFSLSRIPDPSKLRISAVSSCTVRSLRYRMRWVQDSNRSRTGNISVLLFQRSTILFNFGNTWFQILLTLYICAIGQLNGNASHNTCSNHDYRLHSLLQVMQLDQCLF